MNWTKFKKSFEPPEGLSIHLDLGCGARPRNSFEASQVIGVDVATPDFDFCVPNYSFVAVEIGAKLPFPDSFFDSVSAFDFIEHIPRISHLQGETATYLQYLNEIYRVTKPGGLFLAFTPRFPHPAAVADPTHVNFVTKDSINYIAGPAYAKKLNYGLTADFEVALNLPVFSSHPILSESLLLEDVRSSFAERFLLRSKDVLARVLGLQPARSHMLWVLRKR